VSADDGFLEKVERERKHLRKGGPRWLTRYAGGEIPARNPDDDSVMVRLSEGRVIVDPDEAEALGLSLDFGQLDPVVQSALLEDRRRLVAERDTPWPLEMLDAINDTGVWPPYGDCE
jgi:hypothetical protein